MLFKKIKSSLGKQLLKPRANHAYGLSMADSSLELVNLVEDGNQLAIDFFNSVPIEKGVVDRGYIRKFDAFSQAIAHLVKDKPSNDKTITVVTAIPDYQAFTRFLEFKADIYDRKTVGDEIRAEMSKSLPLDLSEVILRTQHKKMPNGDREIMVFATHISLIDNWIKNFSKCGISLAVIEMESLALIRSLVKECKAEESFFIADLGGSTSDLSIVDCDGLRLSASMAHGGNYLTNKIAETLQINRANAEQHKRTIGLIESGHNQVPMILANEVTVLADKINSEITYFESKGKKVNKIYLTGGTSAMPGLVQFMQKVCNREVELGKPWANVKSEVVGSFAIKKKKLPADQERLYASATGLAMRGLNKGNLRDGINFLPEK